MADKKPIAGAGTKPPGGAGDDREARLAAALRENLRRRKSQGREREPVPETPETAEKSPAKG